MHRLEMDKTVLPMDVERWHSFLTFVSNAYKEAEQERYLVERAIEISSSEFAQLAERLEFQAMHDPLTDLLMDVA